MTSPYQGYLYAYPHKTAYRPLVPRPALRDVWAAEARDALFLYLHVPFCETLCWYCGCHTSITRHRGPIEKYIGQLLSEVDQVATSSAATARRISISAAARPRSSGPNCSAPS